MTVAQREFLKICPGCGEIFDTNIDTEANHHNQAEHEPLLPRRKWRRPTQTPMLARAC
jgi:hypothetical protein